MGLNGQMIVRANDPKERMVIVKKFVGQGRARVGKEKGRGRITGERHEPKHVHCSLEKEQNKVRGQVKE